MNYTDFINKIASENELTKAQTERIVKSITSNILTEVKQGGTVQLTKFGTFTSAEYAEREYIVNPRSEIRETKVKPAHRVFKFKPSKLIREL